MGVRDYCLASSSAALRQVHHSGSWISVGQGAGIIWEEHKQTNSLHSVVIQFSLLPFDFTQILLLF